jgi:hypothetical protein
MIDALQCGLTKCMRRWTLAFRSAQRLDVGYPEESTFGNQ